MNILWMITQLFELSERPSYNPNAVKCIKRWLENESKPIIVCAKGVSYNMVFTFNYVAVYMVCTLVVI